MNNVQLTDLLNEIKAGLEDILAALDKPEQKCFCGKVIDPERNECVNAQMCETDLGDAQ